MFLWREAKIRVYAFYCVLALAVAHLMRREAHQPALDLSVRELLTSLAGIEETVLLYPIGTKADPALGMLLASLMIPDILMVRPLYAAYVQFGPIDTHIPLIVPPHHGEHVRDVPAAALVSRH